MPSHSVPVASNRENMTRGVDAVIKQYNYLYLYTNLILQCLAKIKTSIDIPPATEDCFYCRDLEIDHSISRSFKFSSHIPNIAATLLPASISFSSDGINSSLACIIASCVDIPCDRNSLNLRVTS